jgi:uncharacterized membrane protein YccC
MQRSEVLNQVARRLNQMALWRILIHFDRAKIASDMAIRNAIGVVLPLIIGTALGHAPAGAVAALGALNVSYSDSRDPYAARARRMLLSSVLVGAAVTLGALSAHTSVTAVAAATIWAFGAGMMVVLSPEAGNLGITTLVTLVVFAGRRMTPVEAVESGIVAIAGGVLQTLLSIAFWPVQRYEPERRIIGALYSALAGLAVSPAGSGSAPPGTAQLAETEKVLTSLSQSSSRHAPSIEAERYIFLVDQAERIRLSLLTLRRLRQRMGRDPQGTDAAAALDRILAVSSAVLDEIGASVIQGTKAVARDEFSEAVSQFRKLDGHEQSPFLAAAICDAGHQIDALAGQLRAGQELREPRVAAAVRLRDPADPMARVARLRANLSFHSTAFRHAVRLAVCVGMGDAIALQNTYWDLQRTYWVPMTIAIVLRPDFSSTFSRGILRVAGTLAGLLLATGLFHFLHAGSAAEIALLAVFVFLLRWIGPANYGVFVTAVSAFVVLLLALAGVSPKAAIAARAVNTVFGGAIALAAYAIWPTWERTQAGPVLADLMDAYQRYFHAVFDAWINNAWGALDRTRMKARLARSNAEALIDRIVAEPGVTAEHANLLGAILASAHNFVRAVMALESALEPGQPKRVRPATVEFAQQVEATLQGLADALRVSQPKQSLPDLREAHNAILASVEAGGDQYTLINTETDRITTSLNTLSEQIEKLLHR